MFIEDLRDRYIIARWSYLIGEPILGDVEYDYLDKEFKRLYPNDEYSKRHYPFDNCPTELLQKYNLSNLIVNTVMGYAAESIYSINNEPEFRSVFSSLNKKSRLSFKIDGWNMRASYYNGHLVKLETRGRGGNNLDTTMCAKLVPQKIPEKRRVAVTGECNIPNSLWGEFKALTGNNDQRSSVRTAFVNNMVNYLAFLAFNVTIEGVQEEFDHYDKLKEWGFKTPTFRWVESYQQLVTLIKVMSALNKSYDYLTDGLVIENSDYQYAIRLGAWEEHSMWSYVTGYEESQGMYGVALNVKVYPITNEGKTFPTVSIVNIANIEENHLSPGSPIAFNLRSGANVVIDTAETHTLQERWKGKYEEYKTMIEERNKSYET